MYTELVSDGQRRAVWTGTTLAIAAGYTGLRVRDLESIQVDVANSTTDLLVHLGFKHIVSCFKHSHVLKTRAYSNLLIPLTC